MRRSELLQLYPFLEDEEIVRIARNLYDAKDSGDWQPNHNHIVLHLAPDDGKVKRAEFFQKLGRSRKVL